MKESHWPHNIILCNSVYMFCILPLDGVLQREPRVQSFRNEGSLMREMFVRRERSETVEPTSKAASLTSVCDVEKMREGQLGGRVVTVLSWCEGEWIWAAGGCGTTLFTVPYLSASVGESCISENWTEYCPFCNRTTNIMSAVSVTYLIWGCSLHS